MALRLLAALPFFHFPVPSMTAAPQDDPRTLSASPRQNPATHMVFVTFAYQDPMTGTEAFRLLIPQDWKTTGTITWKDNPAMPAQSHFRFFNPQGNEQFELFPTQSYFWTNNPIFLGTNPPGTFRFGTLVAKPVDVSTAFSQTVLPGFRSNLADFRVLEREPMPELAKLALGPPVAGVHSSAEGGKIKIAYRHADQEFGEEIYAVVSQFVIQLPGYYINYWYIDFLFSFRAGKGQLDDHSKIFQTMAFSLRVNPKWFAKLVNTKDQMMEMIIRGIHATGRIGSIVAQAGSDLRADQQRAWELRQNAKDRMVWNFCDNILGIQRYRDPFTGRQVELPNQFNHAWANNLGEYIVTDSSSYNPNIGSNLHWEEIRPVP
jgi:hypothetical protein